MLKLLNFKCLNQQILKFKILFNYFNLFNIIKQYNKKFKKVIC